MDGAVSQLEETNATHLQTPSVDTTSGVFDSAGSFLSSLPSSFWIGLVTVLVVGWGVYSQRSISRKKMTLEYIAAQEGDGDVLGARKIFVLAALNPEGLAKWASKENQGTEEAQAIAIVLNEMELVSIGIQSGVIDYKMYKKWNYSTVKLYWRHAEAYVKVLRERVARPTLYLEFQAMAESFAKEKPLRMKWWRRLLF